MLLRQLKAAWQNTGLLSHLKMDFNQTFLAERYGYRVGFAQKSDIGLGHSQYRER